LWLSVLRMLSPLSAYRASEELAASIGTAVLNMEGIAITYKLCGALTEMNTTLR